MPVFLFSQHTKCNRAYLGTDTKGPVAFFIAYDQAEKSPDGPSRGR